MKKYVHYRFKHNQDPANPHLTVYYSPLPGQRVGTQQDEETDCQYLSGYNVFVGEHSCHFEPEEVEPGVYAIVCREHPDTNQEVTALRR
jgi:hypothetical protein